MSKTNAQSITGKYIFKGQLILHSPLILGSGQSDESADILVLKDEDDKPYIPATSLMGVLRHYFFRKIELDDYDFEKAKYFWGSPNTKDNSSIQSAFYIRDLVLTSEKAEQGLVLVRDGIKIDNTKGVAKERHKYDYEVVEKGTSFDFYAEITLRDRYDKELFFNIADFIITSLQSGEITLGAKTSRGFGRCAINNCEMAQLDFSKAQDVKQWLRREYPFQHYNNINNNPLDLAEEKTFSLEANFVIKNSFIIRSYSGELSAPDAVHITSNGQPILPGTSVSGVLRARAERIINTIGNEIVQKEILYPLFGWADDKGKSMEKYKSRIIVEETSIDNVVSELQNRIKINRFTGGTIKSALFDELALWPKNQLDKMVNIKITINDYKDYEAGLVLLILKDLWNGDIAIGGGRNIGRGFVEGIWAKVTFEGKETIINKLSENKVEINENVTKLERLVEALVNKCKKGGSL